MTQVDAKRWYAVYTQPAQEYRARDNLERQGFTVRLLQQAKKRPVVRGGQDPFWLRPLFPRYLFVALDLSVDQWRPILSTYGCRDIIRNGDHPVPLPPLVAQKLFERADAQGVMYDLRLRKVFAPDDPVRITSGPYEDHVGIFKATSGRERVKILLKILGGEYPVDMDVRMVEPLDD